MKDWENFLKRIYFNPKHPGAFSGPTKLHQILKENNFKTDLKEIRAWLHNQDSYSLLKPVKYKFKRQRIVTTGIDDLWDADLADVSNTSQHNNNIHFWLIVIDIFSRHLWVVPLQNKSSSSMTEAFKVIFQQTARRPKNLRTDKGTEFTNRAVKKLLKSENINAYTTKNETKANYAERVIRTLKGLVYRYFLHNQTYVYTNVLQDLVSNYNQRPHRSLGGKSPKEIDENNEAKMWKFMYIDNMKKRKRKPFIFELGDQVRISHLKYTFQRDYQQKWTEEIFKIKRRVHKQGFNLYQLQDWLDEDIDGHFYEQELQHVVKDLNATFHVEKVLKQRQRQGKQEAFVKWMGWPNKFNSWVPLADIQQI